MTTAFAFLPGLAAFGYGFALFNSAPSCSVSDNASISSISLNVWLIVQGGIGCAWLSTAGYVWMKFQRPFNPRDPRDVNWIARATYLMCYDPYIAVSCLFGILQLAWLIIGAGMNSGFVRNSNLACKDKVLISGFQGILATTWVFCILCVLSFVLVFLYECCCIGVEQINNEMNFVAEGVLGRPQDQQQQHQQQNYYPEQPAYAYPAPPQQQQQQLQQMPHPAVVGAGQYANYAIPGGPGAVPVAIPVANNEAMLEQPTAVPIAIAVPVQQQQYQPQQQYHPQQQQQQQQQQHPVIQNAAAIGLGLLTQGVRFGTAAARITATAATAAVNAVAHEVRDQQIARNGQQPRR